VPGTKVHLHLTMEWAIEAGLCPDDAQQVATADLTVDELWPGSRIWWRHFNPTASVLYAPLEMVRAARAQRRGERADALKHLGRSLHSCQDAIGHGRLGQNHLAWNLGLLHRDPDDWELMPPSVKQRIEQASRRVLRRFVAI
jgi:hypothetical protein